MSVHFIRGASCSDKTCKMCVPLCFSRLTNLLCYWLLSCCVFHECTQIQCVCFDSRPPDPDHAWAAVAIAFANVTQTVTGVIMQVPNQPSIFAVS